MYEPIPTWTLGDRLRKIRRDNADGITQKAFAESIGVGGPAYTAWEGDRSFPREPDDLAAAFGVPISDLYDGLGGRITPDEWAPRDSDPQPTGYRPRHLVLVPQLSEVA